jgi:hypothetical protein
LLTCRVPESGAQRNRRPTSVSLVERRCEQAETRLRVHFDKPRAEKEDFAVCVVGMTLVDDWSVRLAEWVELLGLLGVKKIFLYTILPHHNLKKV